MSRGEARGPAHSAAFGVRGADGGGRRISGPGRWWGQSRRLNCMAGGWRPTISFLRKKIMGVDLDAKRGAGFSPPTSSAGFTPPSRHRSEATGQLYA